MHGAGTVQTHEKSRKSKSYGKRSRKSKSHGSTLSSPMCKKTHEIMSKRRRKDGKCRNAIDKSMLSTATILNEETLIKCGGEKLTSVSCTVNGTPLSHEKFKRRRRHKRRKNNVELDEASRLQRRTKYLLIKMKVEQNLLDAYSTEGWKGQSREKIKPENELQRAKRQILKCKLGLRDAIRQLDLLGSVGCIDDSAIAPDGSVHHEHIHCAKCKLREAFPDNDIILCDGTCNCAFHQKCIDPPLLTENIPPGDQSWFCKFCECKMDILEAVNAHLGTNFSPDSNWQEIFTEEAGLPDNVCSSLHPEQEWPSDDSEDDDYDPERSERFEDSCSHGRVSSEGDEHDVSSSTDLCSLENEIFPESSKRGLSDSDGTTDCEIINGRRQRRPVDYKTLYHEMFGKDAPLNEQLSEDEDWGPTKRKRREKESDAASTLMTLCETDKKCPNNCTTNVETKESFSKTKRHLFRIPADAVEKLRAVFMENELPSRTIKENLSKQLGLDPEKVNKWFKNTRYLALKTRKAGDDKPLKPITLKESGVETEKDRTYNQVLLENESENVSHTPSNRHPKECSRSSNCQSLTSSPGKQKQQQQLPQQKEEILVSQGKSKADIETGDDVSLKSMRENAKREKKKVVFNSGDGEQEAEAEAEMERLSRMKIRLEKLQQVLQRLPNIRLSTTESSIIYVPVAHLKEKT